MTEKASKYSSCPICECQVTDLHQLAVHLFNKAQVSDGQHIMWLNRNLTKFQVPVEKLYKLLEQSGFGKPNNQDVVTR